MVSTRSQSQNTPEPTTSPSKAAVARGSGGQASTAQPWAHRPSNLTIVWLAITVPLVLWDTGYILLRPYSMPGGSLHSPIWTPYALYGAVDYMYGWPAYNSRDGFPSGQGMMNLIECTMYTWYLWLVYSHGQPSAEKGRGAPKPSTAGWLGEAKVLSGPMAAEATLWLFSAGVMTLSKTILYCMCSLTSPSIPARVASCCGR